MTTKAKKKQDDQMIYLGPSLPNGLLSQHAVFRDGIPKYLGDLLAAKPEIELLIVPVTQIIETKTAINDYGSPQFNAYQSIKKGV